MLITSKWPSFSISVFSFLKWVMDCPHLLSVSPIPICRRVPSPHHPSDCPPCKTIFKARVFVSLDTSQFSNLDHHYQQSRARWNAYVSYPVDAGGQLALGSVSTCAFSVLNSEPILRARCKKWPVCLHEASPSSSVPETARFTLRFTGWNHRSHSSSWMIVLFCLIQIV